MRWFPAPPALALCPRAGLLLLITLLGLGCAAPSRPPPPPAGGPSGPARGPLAGLDPRRWVTIYDPARAWNGYTLALYRRRMPILMDMNGRVVHAWPSARVKSRIRLLADGSLLGIARGRRIVEYDWDGRLIWDYRLAGELPHHDVVRLANGNTLILTRPAGSVADRLLEVDRGRRVVWEWDAREHLARYFGATVDRGDVTHVNSVQELPPNPWFERGDERFRPGNLLLSARNLNAVFVVDRETGEVVWTFDDKLDLQHEALMIEPGFAGHGRIVILSNGRRGTYGYRQSAVLEVAPVDGSIVWEYRADEFFTPTGGVEQPLPNGNVLITSARGGRTFEVTRGGEIVWQWVPPFHPTRSRRYAYDHCPQSAALARPSELRVRPAAGYRHVDRPLYRFSRRGERRTAEIDGRKIAVLESNNVCRKLLLPAAATLEVAYGLDRDRIASAGRDGYAARFGLRMRLEGSGEEVELLAEEVDLAADVHRSHTIALAAYAHRWLRLCTETAELGAPFGRATEGLAYWMSPAITTAAGEDEADEGADDELTAEERRVRTEHLKALGYVD